jgi:tetratricopeptide (TPR) repeat protein
MAVVNKLKRNSRELFLLIALLVIGAIAFFPTFGGKIWGSRLIRQADYLTQYDRMVQRDPQNLEAVYLRGLQRCHAGQFEGAIDDMTKCLESNPRRQDALTVRCTAEYKMKRYDQALNDINSVLKFNKQDADYWLMRADVYTALGRKDLADQDYERSKQYLAPGERPHIKE